jgi:hypothetical protein
MNDFCLRSNLVWQSRRVARNDTHGKLRREQFAHDTPPDVTRWCCDQDIHGHLSYVEDRL